MMTDKDHKNQEEQIALFRYPDKSGSPLSCMIVANARPDISRNWRKKFEKPHINELWLSDFMHGQRFSIEHKPRKLFLCGIIDDYSRLLVGCQWTRQENTEALELVLKDALLTYGLPKILYCDNGAVYASQHLQVVCARLGIALVHSKPYDSPARGKTCPELAKD